MRRPSFRSTLRVALLACVAVAAPVEAQDVDAILARYNAAVDPENKLATMQGMKVAASFEIAAAGMRADMTIHRRRPNQLLAIITITGLGEMRQGTDGATTWTTDPMSGPRILTGTAAAAITDAADFTLVRRERAAFSAIETAGEADLDGERCTRLKFTWKSGRVTTDCFSDTSGLLLESSGTESTPQGEIQASTRLSDYRPVGGVMVAHKSVTSLMGIQQVITYTEITAGEQDPRLFELPPAIRALRGNP